MTRVSLPESWRRRAIVIGDVLITSDWFAPRELTIADSFRLQKRRSEWKHARIAAKQLALDLGLCASATECVVDERRLIIGSDAPRYVSISHSGGYAAAAIDTTPVGIDIERRRAVSEGAAHLFLTDGEAEQMRTCSIADRLVHFWAAKEAAWKQLGGAVQTLKRVPLRFEQQSPEGLRFDKVETLVCGDVVVALTRPTS